MTPLDILRRYWGYDSFRPMQAEIIDSVLAGNDTLGLMATGGGKSLTFQVPSQLIDGLTLVITPLISLMKDQVDNVRQAGIAAYCLHSGMSRHEVNLALKRCRMGKARLLYISPEKLASETFISELRSLPVALLVVDEAHCISQWGYDFRPSYLQIGRLRPMFPDAPVLALTASATANVAEDIRRQLGFRKGHRTFRLSFDRRNLSYIVRRCDDKYQELTKILKRMPGCGIVYVRSRRKAAEVAEHLRLNGISAGYYHAGLEPKDKTERQTLWKEGKMRVMVATTAFGMGIDKPDVRIVVHFDPPSSLEEYYQEAGRAGRDGLESYAVMLVNARYDKATLSRRVAESFPPRDFLCDVYFRLCVYLDVAMGEGYQKLYRFEIDKFCKQYGFPPVLTYSALQIIARSGYIDYIEDPTTRGKLMVVAARHELYSLRLSEDEEKVFQYVLRNYEGIFTELEPICEENISAATGLTMEQVYQTLLGMAREHIIQYVPRRTHPCVCFLRSREPVSDLRFPCEVYEYRKKAMEQRVDWMKRFLFDDDHCRVQTLLRYFDESAEAVCGKCDVCRSKKNESQGNDTAATQAKNLETILPELLKTHFPGGATLLQLSEASGYPEEKVAAACRNLLSLGTLTLSGAILKLAR